MASLRYTPEGITSGPGSKEDNMQVYFSPYKWNDDMITKFLEEYRSHACLWDCRNEGYKNKEVRMEAYESLARAMNLPGVDVSTVRSKIRVIRNTYTLELKKVVYRFAGKDYYPTLSWFPIADSFLRDVIQLKTAPQGATPVNSLPEDEIQILEDDHAATDVDYQDLDAQSPVYILEPENEAVDTPFFRRKRSRQETEVQIEEQGFLDPDVQQSTTAEGDEYDLFAKYIACQLRKLPVHHALVCQDRIHSFIIQQRLEAQQELNNSQIPKLESGELNH